MDEFELLKQSWKKQEAPDNLKQLEAKAYDGFKQQQRKVIFSNLFTSIGFALAFIVMGWIWSSFPGRTPFFYTGIAVMYLLMIVMLYVLWSGVQYRNIDSGLSSKEYIGKVRNKLLFRKKTLTTYNTIYSVLLGLALGCYYIDLSLGQSLKFILLMYGSTAAYIAFIMFVTRKRKRRNIEKIDNLLLELDELDQRLSI